MWGWCKSREDYRLFKLNRMDKVHMSENYFSERIAPFPDLRDERIFPGGIKVKAVFEADYTDKENLITWLLSFRDKVELLEPKAIREELRQSILQMKKKYDNAMEG